MPCSAAERAQLVEGRHGGGAAHGAYGACPSPRRDWGTRRASWCSRGAKPGEPAPTSSRTSASARVEHDPPAVGANMRDDAVGAGAVCCLTQSSQEMTIDRS